MLATKAATKPEDLKGLKIRVPNIRLSNEMMNAMGATATPMPLAEAYPALMQGVINGAENPIPVLYGGKMFEGAKFLLMTRHQVNLSSWIAGTGFIKKLPPEIVKMLKETGEERPAGSSTRKTKSPTRTPSRRWKRRASRSSKSTALRSRPR